MTRRTEIAAWAVLAVVLALGVMLSACSLFKAPQTYVDGLPVGVRLEGVEAAETSPRFAEFAIATLDAQAPDHPKVTATEVYLPDFRAQDGTEIVTTRSGGRDLIVVMRLEDESVRAFYVGCGMGDRCYLGGPGELTGG